MPLDEVFDEIRQRAAEKYGNKVGHDVQEGPKPDGSQKPRRRGRPKTKDEVEAYRQKKMAEEEARYLKVDGKNEDRPRRGRKPAKAKAAAQEAKPVEPASGNRSKTDVPARPKAKTPKMLQPMEVLYLLKIPGLPKGDCIAICLAHGAES